LKSIAVILLIAFMVGCIGQNASQISWETDAQVALDKAKSEKKSLLLFFYDSKATAVIGGESVNPSEWMDKNVFSDPRVVKLLRDKFISVRLNGETKENVSLAHAYGSSVFPFFIVVDANRKVCTTFSGILEVNNFLKKMEGCEASTPVS
jgi:thioredoxin-related protein